MDINSYIDSELFIIVPVLYIIGAMIKKSTVNDKWIPIILGVIGIVLATVYKLSIYLPKDALEVLQVIYAGITQGILCAAGSVYANNIIKQIGKDGKKEDEGGSQGDSTDD